MRFSIPLTLLLSSACTEPAPVMISDPPVENTTAGTQPTTTSETEETTEPPDGQCGDVSYWDLSVEGAIVDDRDRPYPGVEITLEDRGWIPGTIMGTATTDDEGYYRFDVDELTSVEDCWGTLLDYVMVATDGDLVAEQGVNAQLYGAITDGSLEVDLTVFPLILE